MPIDLFEPVFLYGKMKYLTIHMQEQEIKAVLAENIKKYRSRRGWSQLFLSEKLGISANFLSQVETGKAWVSPLTLSKLASALEIEVFELFKPPAEDDASRDDAEVRKLGRFAEDLALALEVSVSEAAKNLRGTIAKIRREYTE